MFGRLLVPLDGSSLAEQALGPAAAIARAAGAEVDLVLVHRPLPFAGYDDAPWNAEQVTSEDKYLETTAADLMSAASVPVTGRRSASPTGREISRSLAGSRTSS